MEFSLEQLDYRLHFILNVCSIFLIILFFMLLFLPCEKDIEKILILLEWKTYQHLLERENAAIFKVNTAWWHLL